MKTIFLMIAAFAAIPAFADYPCSYKDKDGEIQKLSVTPLEKSIPLNMIRVDFPGATPSRYFVRNGNNDEAYEFFEEFATVESNHVPILAMNKKSLFGLFNGEGGEAYTWSIHGETFKIDCSRSTFKKK